MTRVSRVETVTEGVHCAGVILAIPGRSLPAKRGSHGPLTSEVDCRPAENPHGDRVRPLAFKGALSRPPVPTGKVFSERARCAVVGHAVAPQAAWGLFSCLELPSLSPVAPNRVEPH